MALQRSTIIVVSALALAIAVTGDEKLSTKQLEAESQTLGSSLTQQLMTALAKLRSDYDASEAAELKAQSSAAVKAALQKGSATLAKMRVPQRAALQAFAKKVGSEVSKLTANYTKLINQYESDKKAAANKSTNRAAILQLRKSKQALLVGLEEDVVSLQFAMRSALRTAYQGVASSSEAQQAVNASVVRLVDALIGYQTDILVLLTAKQFAEVNSFSARANAALLHLTNQAQAAAST